ncbi:MAG: class I SAM-dependent methyltransferase [Pyrinomonadaceae bacterium MAG19_C2-C3]|nr:class I SAM-dependent methyltransferase [Pyrinomonadaceae bacterium MAG19_C2-C3]
MWHLELAQAETQTSAVERACLARHAANRKHLVEIGVWHGVTTCRLRRAMKSDGILWAVDPYRAGRLGFSIPQKIAHREVAKVPNGKVAWQRLTGVQAAAEFARCEDKADFIFIDGDHSYEGIKADWEAWKYLIARDGIIALHDSCSSAGRQIDEAGSAIFTRTVILNDADFELVEQVDTLTIVRRK